MGAEKQRPRSNAEPSRAFVHGLAIVCLLVCTVALLPVLGAELTQIAETAKQFTSCMVPLERQISFFGLPLGRSFEGTAVLIARVEVGGETYDLWVAPQDTYDAGKLVMENVKKTLLAVIEPWPGWHATWLFGPRFVITAPTDLTPLAALCSLSLPEDLEKPEQVVIVGFDKKGDKLVRFVSFASPTIGFMWPSGYEGDLYWEHRRTDVAGALVLTWRGTGATTQDFLPIGIYGPWEYLDYTWKYTRWERSHRKQDVETLHLGVSKIAFSELPKQRVLNIVRAAFGLELEPETSEPELEW